MERIGRGHNVATTVYPIDVTTLNKGDVFPIAQCEQLVLRKFGTPQYSFGMLKLRQYIMRRRREIGMPVTVAIRKGELHILTDEHAATYNVSQFNQGRRRVVRATRRHAEVDLRNLTDEQRSQYDKDSMRLARTVLAIRQEQRQAIPMVQPHKRID